MKTLKIQTSLFTEEKSISSPEASHANRSAMQGKETEHTITDISGLNIYERYGKFSPLPSLVKTLLVSCQWSNMRCSLEWKVKTLYAFQTTTNTKVYTHDKVQCLSTTYVKTLKKKDMTFKRLLFRLQVSMPPTEGIGSGLLPTPLVSEIHHPKRVELLIKRNAKGLRERKKGEPGANGLLDYIHFNGLLQTPTTMERAEKPEVMRARAKKKGYKNGTKYNSLKSQILYDPKMKILLPTPTSTNYKGASSTEALEKRGRLKEKADNLADQFAISGETSQLNPRFVAEMMGFPPNWTELPFLNGDKNP